MDRAELLIHGQPKQFSLGEAVSPLRLRNSAVTVIRHEGGGLVCERWGGTDHLPDVTDIGPGPIR